MWTWIGLTVAALLAVGIGLLLVLVVSMRTKYAPVLNVIRRMNRRFTNTRAMQTAGTPGAVYSVIHHVGRSTGASYRTPIGAISTDEGFVIGLPYGANSDWLKNVRAAGSAMIATDGRTHHVTDPQVVPAVDVDRFFSARERLIHRIYGVTEFLVLTRVSADVPPA